jgi:hypothetical protein
VNREFSGQSLFLPMNNDRIIPIVGKDMIDTKSYISGAMKYIETVHDGNISNEAFEYIADAHETKNLWQTLTENKKNEVQNMLHKVDSVSTAMNK